MSTAALWLVIWHNPKEIRKISDLYAPHRTYQREREKEFMEDTFKRHRQTLAKPQSLTTETTATAMTNDVENGDLSIEQGNSEMWNNFSNRFRQVQSVLDRNRLLIHQVNENHQSRTNDNMVQNVGLIHELNGNISKVVSLYSDISTMFSDANGNETNNH